MAYPLRFAFGKDEMIAYRALERTIELTFLKSRRGELHQQF